jgi:hypothetical protein
VIQEHAELTALTKSLSPLPSLQLLKSVGMADAAVVVLARNSGQKLIASSTKRGSMSSL